MLVAVKYNMESKYVIPIRKKLIGYYGYKLSSIKGKLIKLRNETDTIHQNAASLLS